MYCRCDFGGCLAYEDSCFGVSGYFLAELVEGYILIISSGNNNYWPVEGLQCLNNGLFICFLRGEHVLQLIVFNFGKKVNFQVKNMLPVRPTNRQSIVLISDKRSTYG